MHGYFLVADTLIDLDQADRRAAGTVTLEVDSPNDIAEQCWNAGYTVRPHDDDTDERCSAFLITDAFGRSILLTPRAERESVRASA
jgi:hypothetical protein